MPAMQWSTYQGDIHVQSPSQWNSLYSSYQQLSFASGYDNRQAEVFRLCFRVGNISVCNGCRNKFDKQAKPPNDLCVRSGVHIPRQFLNYLNPDLEMHTTMRTLIAFWLAGHSFLLVNFLFLMTYEIV